MCLQSTETPRNERYAKLKSLLMRVGEENGFQVVTTPMEKKSTMGKYHCTVEITTNPIVIGQGNGETAEEAEHNAIITILDFIKYMII